MGNTIELKLLHLGVLGLNCKITETLGKINELKMNRALVQLVFCLDFSEMLCWDQIL